MSSQQRLALAAVLASLSLAGCATHSTGTGAAASPHPVAIEFDNKSNGPVRVYLIGWRAERHLGRVEAFRSARLPLPRDFRAEPAEILRLAVLPDGAISLRASRDRRATLSLGEPTAHLLMQRWIFTGGHLTGYLHPERRR